MQIPLSFQPLRDDRLAEFVAGPNRAALQAMAELSRAPGGSVLLTGAAGTGKSHLLNGTCRRAQRAGHSAICLSLSRLDASQLSLLDGLEALDLVAVDDLHLVAGDKAWEEGLFHLFNRVRDAEGCLLMTSRLAPQQLATALPDLRSRLSWGLTFQLQPLDDEEKLQVLQQAARRHDIELPEEVGRYLLRHGPRELEALKDNFERLQQAAFAGKRALTIPLAREILAA